MVFDFKMVKDKLELVSVVVVSYYNLNEKELKHSQIFLGIEINENYEEVN